MYDILAVLGFRVSSVGEGFRSSYKTDYSLLECALGSLVLGISPSRLWAYELSVRL